jgi:hypothetical protein
MVNLLEVASEMEKRNSPKRVDGLSKIPVRPFMWMIFL